MVTNNHIKCRPPTFIIFQHDASLNHFTWATHCNIHGKYVYLNGCEKWRKEGKEKQKKHSKLKKEMIGSVDMSSIAATFRSVHALWTMTKQLLACYIREMKRLMTVCQKWNYSDERRRTHTFGNQKRAKCRKINWKHSFVESINLCSGCLHQLKHITNDTYFDALALHPFYCSNF